MTELMGISRLFTATVATALALNGCSLQNCAYYGGADASVHCVVVGPSPIGGGQ